MKKQGHPKSQGGTAAPPIKHAPPEIAAAIDKISGEDRLWFEAHPGAEFRTRPAAPGEFWPVLDSATVLYVIVTQVRPGYRLRAPILRMNLPESDWIQ